MSYLEQPLVIKFGGTSVGGGAEFVRAASIAAEAAQERPVAVVVSAMSGTTDILLGYANISGSAWSSSTGGMHEGAIAELHRTLADRHLKAARQAVAEEHLPQVERRVLALLGELVEEIKAPATDRAARRAAITVFGERLSATVLAGAISSAGAPAGIVGADPIATDAGFGEAEADAARTRERCSRYVEPLLDEGIVAVVPGYGGRSPEGLQTTLGRGGSDLSATVLGRALGSEEVWIMSDVDGVLDADPRLVPNAALMPRLSYREAGIFAGLGAKVLHYKTMEPAEEAGIEVRVRNTFNPGCVGTRVSAIEDGDGVRCVALRRNLAVEVPCTHGRESVAAMVVCIGSRDEADLDLGRRTLREAGMPLLHAGTAAAGLVFMVSARAGEETLRVLHEALVSRYYSQVEEVA